jgi:hypothetical protein
MPRLLSGSTLRTGGSGEFIDLRGAQPQLPATDSTTTGFTLVTDSLLRTTYRSSLGNLEFNQGTIYNNIPDGNITLVGTGTGFVYVSSGTISTSTTTGALVIRGGVGIGESLWVDRDIHVNGLTIGRGYEGLNNIVIQGSADPQINGFNNGQESIAIGYDALLGLSTAYKNIAIGRYALSSGTEISNSIAIGDSALKEIGSIHSTPIVSISSATAYPSQSISSISKTNPVSVTIPSHGLTTGTRVLITGVTGLTYLGISIVNGNLFYIVPTSPNSFDLYTNKALTNSLNGTLATSYISSGTIYNPVIVTANNHGLSTGTNVEINDVVGMTQLNGNRYYVDAVTTNTLALYSDEILNIPVDGTGYSAYVSGGNVYKIYLRHNNIAIGTNAAAKLVDGEQNFFFGDGIAQNFSTGSYNFFIGHDVAGNMTHGNYNIAIGGDNLVNGVDNQVNIGSVFYYNGTGYLQLNADTGLGLNTRSTGTNNGSLTVLGGVGISDNLNVGDTVAILSTATNTSTAASNALYVAGGAGIAGSLRVGTAAFFNGELIVGGSGNAILSPSNAEVLLKPTGLGTVEIYPEATGVIDNMIIGYTTPADGYFNNLRVKSVTDNDLNTSTNGSLVITGGVGIGKSTYIAGDLKVVGTIYGNTLITNVNTAVNTATNLSAGQAGSIVYQLSSGVTGYLPIGVSGSILQSNGSAPYWTTSTSFGTVIATSLTVTGDASVGGLLTATTLSVAGTSTVGGNSTIGGNVIISTTTAAISTITGALQVAGGTGIGGSLYVGGSLTVGPVTFGTSVTAISSNNFLIASYTSNTITGSGQVNLDQWSSTVFRSARYTVQITDGTDIHITEIVIFHDGTDVYINEYGISTNRGILGAFDAILNSNLVTLRFTPVSATAMVIKIVRTTITV